MPKNTYILIDPQAQTLKVEEFADYKEAVRAAGLDPMELDHGTVARASAGHGFGIWVYEWGLKTPKVDSYFALNRQLFNGPAVLYGFDAEGETSDCTPEMAKHIEANHLTWAGSAIDVERLIRANAIDRPQSAINGTVYWKWEAASGDANEDQS